MRRIQRQNGTQPQLSTSTQDSSANQPPLSIPYEDDVRFPNRQDVQISPCCATCLPQACSGCFNAGWYYQDSCGHICGLPTNYNTDCFPSNRTYCNDLCNYCSCCCNCTPKAETSVRQIQNNPAAETRNIAVGSSPSKIEGPQNQRRTKTLANKAVQSHIEEATGTKPSPRKSIKMIKSGKNIGVQVLTSKQSTVPGPANVGTFQEPVPTRRLNDPSVDTLSIQDFRAFVPTEIDAYPEVGSSLTPTKPVSTASQVLPKFKPPSIFHFEPNTRPRNLPSNPKHSMPTDEPVFKMSEPRADTVIPRPPGFVSSPKIETTSSTPTPKIETLSPTPTPNIGTLSPTPTPNIETISPTPTPNTETLSPTPTPNIATLSPTPTPNIATLSSTPTPNIGILSPTPTPNTETLSPTPTPNTETLSPTPTPNTETLSSTPTPNIGTLSSTPTPNIESINSTPTPKMVSINSNPTTIIEAESTLRPIIKTKSTPTKNVVTLWTPNTTLDGTRESTFSKIEPSTAKAEGFDEDVVKILTQVLTPIMATIPESSKCSNGMTLTIRLNSKSRTVKPSSSLISKPGKTKSILKQSKTENLSVTASCRSTGCFSGNSKPSKIPSCRSTRYFSGNPQKTPSCRNSTCFGASINSAKTPSCRSKTCFGRNTDLSKSPSCRSSTRLTGKIGTAKTYTSKSSTALDRNLNTPTLHSCRGTGCFSGNTNPPSCRSTSCFSGNTNPTSCRSTSCLGGAINPPTCRSTSCFSGNTNPTSCRSTSCLGGAINPPTCRSTSCFSGNTNPTSCRSTSCFGGAINPPSCHSTSCFGGAIKPATCRSTSCSIGNINPPSCRSTSCSSGNTNPPSCRSTSCSSGNTNPPSCHSISCSSGNTNPPSCHSTSCSSGNHNPPSCHSTSCFGGNTNPPSCRSSACFGGSINPSKMSSCHSITCLDLNSAFIPVCRSTSCNITKQNLSNCETPSCRMHATPVTFSKTGRSNFPASIHTSTTQLPNPDVFHRNPDISAAPTQSMQTSTPDFSMNKSPPEICRPSFPDIICFRANTSCSCRPSNSTCKCPSSSPKIEYNVPKPSKPRKPHKEPSLNNVPFAPPPKFMKTNQPKPVIPNLQPVIPIPQPVIPIPQPVIPIPQPVIPIPQPVIPIPQPVIPIPQPVIPIPQPVIPIPRPVIPIPRPVIPNPVIRQPDQPVPSGPPLTSDVTEQPAAPLGYGQPSIRPGYQTSILKKSVTPPPNFGVTPSPTTGYSWPPSAHSSVTSPPPMRSNFGTPLRSGCSVHALNPCDPKKSTSIPSPNCCSPCCPIYVLSQNNCNTVSCPTITDCDKGCILSVPCFDCIETSNGLLCRPNSEELIWNGQPTNTTWSLTFSGKSATRQCNEKNARSYSRKKACRA